MPFCVACGAEHPAAARFCPSCGRPIEGATTAPTAPAVTRKMVTVLFADIVGSTSLGEHHDAETVQALLADYFERAAATIRRHGGTVEKFIGDAVVAVFGVPETHEDDAVRAVRAAVEFRDAVAGLGSDAGSAISQLQVRVGVTTGEVVVGDPSTGQTFSVGDAMNTAARLQQNAAPGQILIGDLTYDLIGDAVTAEFAGALALKGKQASVRAWAVTAVAADRSGRRRLDAPLVGRRAEIAELQRALSVVSGTGRSRLFTLLADAGVGKSKLAHEFVIGANATALHGRCLSYGEGVTFWPLVEVLRNAVGAADDTPGAVEPGIRQVLAGDEAVEQITALLLEILSGAGASNAQELFWAVRRFLEALAVSGPVVLVIDDIHWAEPTFLDLLEYLAVWTAAPLLLVCTARPELIEDRPEWPGIAGSEVLELSPLQGDQAQQLVTALLGASMVDPAAVRRIAAASEGNPLYVEEMVRMLADGGGRLSLDDLRVPPTVQALIAARVDRLDAPAQAALQQAAVVGAEFSVSALSALADDGVQRELMGVLGVLTHREFVVPQPAVGEGEYRFAHGLIRDVAYAATPKRQRTKLHARLAGWLQDRAATDDAVQYDEIVGHHLGQAAALRMELELFDDETQRLAAEASQLLSVAGRRALARSDLPAATKLLRRAASLSADDADRAQLQLELCDALIEMGELAEVEELVPRLRELAGSDERLQARAAVAQAMLDMNLDVDIDRDDIVRRFDSIVAVLEAAGDYVGCAQANQVLADVHWNDSRFEASQKDLETALRFADRAGDARERGRIVTWLASALLWGPAHAADAIVRCEEIVDGANGDLLVEGKTLLILAGLYAYQGRFDEARRTFARSRQIGEDLGLSLSLASGTQVSGMIEMLAGEPAAAEAEFRRGYEALVAMGQKGFLPAAAAFLAGALLAQERYAEAGELAAELERTAADDDEAAQGDFARIACRLAVARGELVAGVAFAQRAVAAYAGTDEIKSHADALHDLAFALAAAGEVQSARAAADEARRLYDLKGIVPAVAAVDVLIESLEAPQAAH